MRTYVQLDAHTGENVGWKFSRGKIPEGKFPGGFFGGNFLNSVGLSQLKNSYCTLHAPGKLTDTLWQKHAIVGPVLLAHDYLSRKRTPVKPFNTWLVYGDRPNSSNVESTRTQCLRYNPGPIGCILAF